jgi:3-phosphoshikimate 1-carboxyvinyltransferase
LTFPAELSITPVQQPIRGAIRPPGSKSITNRALVCAALADGTSILRGALASEDTHVMLDSLRRLGLHVEVGDGGQTLVVAGMGGKLPAPQAELFVGNSGTTIRFLTAVCALGTGRYVLDGVPRMRQRPIGDLLSALRQLGVRCGGQEADQFPPVWIEGGGLRGGTAKVRGDISSQFLSGLLLAAPKAQGPVTLVVDGPLVSRPYVTMTLQIMRAFGITVEAAGSQFFVPAPQPYRPTDYAIEPDASAASYFWAAAAITGGCVTVQGLSRRSLQGDVAFVECLAQMGCAVEAEDHALTVRGRALRGIEVDMNAISDTVPTLAVVALFAEGPTTIRGVAHIRHKETDRIEDLARELRKFGAVVETRPDGLTIVPPAATAMPGAGPVAPIETYRDHRMAMSFALAGLVRPGVVILDPSCTAKTYPDFFADLTRLCHGASA